MNFVSELARGAPATKVVPYPEHADDIRIAA
jgi:hypothetical protein